LRDAVLDCHSRRLATYDGATLPESLFYYFRIEDHQVPENHLLRLIDRHVGFQFVGDELRDSYSETARPSIDSEVLLRILLLGYLYGITSERKLTFGPLSFRCYKTDMSKLYTPCDAAQGLAISCAALKQWIYLGKLKSIQTGGGHHRIPEAEVDRLLPHQWTQSTHRAGH
jgi:excisionase family DNA binding protein